MHSRLLVTSKEIPCFDFPLPFYPHAFALLTHQELSHAALETYQAIGRLRSARLIGKSLAEFYM